MWIKFWSACLLVTLVNAEYLYDSNPYAHYGGYASSYDNYKPTNYKFEYGVSDPHTGDHKSQWEVKENGVVRGAYSLLEPDGTTRLVEYYADDTGFHADVKKLGTAVHAAAPEYGQLHALSESHITNSLAYNGYGHGGVTHDYGAPIAATVKVAAAPIEVQHAPIAQVQHIAPIPQVIAPQIHHLGSPHNYGYGHEIPQFYSAPEVSYHDQLHHENVYAAPVPVLQHPTPFKIHAEPHYEQGPIIKEYAPEIAHYAQPQQIVKQVHYAEPQQIVKQVHYAEPQQIVKQVHYAEPQIVKQVHYAEPQIVKQVVQPQVVKYAEVGPAPEYYAKYAPEPSYLKYAAAPTKYVEQAYAQPQEYLPAQIYAAPAPAPAPIAKVAVAAKVQTVNPFARFFAPLAKYFTAPGPIAKTVVVPNKIVPTQAVYAEAPAKYIDYEAYQGYKPEVVLSSPHNYGPNPGYSYSHDY